MSLQEIALAQIEKHCNRKFMSDKYLEAHDGKNQILCLEQAPIIEVNLVITTDDAKIDYRAFNLEGIIGLSRPINSQIIVLYEAGFTKLPYTVNMACERLANYFKETGQTEHWPLSVCNLLTEYKRR